MNLQFVQAGNEDKEQVFAFYRSLVGTEFCVWTSEYPTMVNIEDDLARDALFCLKDELGRIVGTISIDLDAEVEKLDCWSPKYQPSAELSRLGVSSAYQNQGLARMLLQEGMNELKKRGMKSVHFLVCKTNIKAIRSYDKLSFEVVGECQMFGNDYWCYEKVL